MEEYEVRYELKKDETKRDGYEYRLLRPFEVFDMPPEVVGKLLRLAKEKYANKAWLAIRDLMEKNETYEKMDKLQMSVVSLGNRVSKLEDEIIG